jgi:hypothetical protein
MDADVCVVRDILCLGGVSEHSAKVAPERRDRRAVERAEVA